MERVRHPLEPPVAVHQDAFRALEAVPGGDVPLERARADAGVYPRPPGLRHIRLDHEVPRVHQGEAPHLPHGLYHLLRRVGQRTERVVLVAASPTKALGHKLPLDKRLQLDMPLVGPAPTQGDHVSVAHGVEVDCGAHQLVDSHVPRQPLAVPLLVLARASEVRRLVRGISHDHSPAQCVHVLEDRVDQIKLKARHFVLHLNNQSGAFLFTPSQLRQPSLSSRHRQLALDDTMPLVRQRADGATVLIHNREARSAVVSRPKVCILQQLRVPPHLRDRMLHLDVMEAVVGFGPAGCPGRCRVMLSQP
mmetsp:Transcript_32832/g.103826  ORF Transcript_32832/g.103826 Transcript_32832/m.103826 type:complete len:306 (-) Transcript_32832:656-1573(-)